MENNEKRNLWSELREADPELYKVLLYGTTHEREVERETELAHEYAKLRDHIDAADNLAKNLIPFIEWVSLVVANVRPANSPAETIMGPLRSGETGQIYGVSMQHGLDLLEAFELFQTYRMDET